MSLVLLPFKGVIMHHLSSNSSAKPAFGPLFSVPAIGWAGTKFIFFLIKLSTSEIEDSFADPTSVTMASLVRCGDIFLKILL